MLLNLNLLYLLIIYGWKREIWRSNSYSFKTIAKENEGSVFKIFLFKTFF